MRWNRYTAEPGDSPSDSDSSGVTMPIVRLTHALLGVRPREPEADRDLVQATERALRTSRVGIDRFFFDAFGGTLPDTYAEPWAEVRAALLSYEPRKDRSHAYWSGEPCSMLIDEVEAIWAPIAEHDDWTLLNEKVASIRAMGEALGR